MTRETFKTNWRGWVRSSEGYAVRIVGRNDLQYKDEFGLQHVFVEPMAKWTEIVVDASRIVERPERSRDEVLDRLHRVFAFRGWRFLD